MQTTEKSNLIKALKEGTVVVTFEKIDTKEIRVMPCTLNPDLLIENNVNLKINNLSADSDHFLAWALDKQAWRSFRLSTVISWEKK